MVPVAFLGSQPDVWGVQQSLLGTWTSQYSVTSAVFVQLCSGSCQCSLASLVSCIWAAFFVFDQRLSGTHRQILEGDSAFLSFSYSMPSKSSYQFWILISAPIAQNCSCCLLGQYVLVPGLETAPGWKLVWVWCSSHLFPSVRIHNPVPFLYSV